MAMAIPLIAMGAVAVGSIIAGANGLGANQRDAKQYDVDDSAYDPYGGALGGMRSKYSQDMYQENVGAFDQALTQLKPQVDNLKAKRDAYAASIGRPDLTEHNPVVVGADGHLSFYGTGNPELDRMNNVLAGVMTQQYNVGQQRQLALSNSDQRTYIGSLEQSGLDSAQQANTQGNQLMGAGMGNYGQASNLTLAAAQGAAPSVAELQAKQQMGQANQQALGMAASARGGAASALASRAAIQQMGQNDQNIIQQNGILRANEMATARGQLGTLAGQGLGAANQQYSLGEQARENAIGSGLAARGMFSDAAQNRESLKAQVQKGFDERNLAVGQQKAEAGARLFQGAVGGITAAAGMGAKG